MQIGYMRVSKVDGTQTLDLQKDALLVAGIETQHIYEDLASGRKLRYLINTVMTLSSAELASAFSPATVQRSTPPPPAASCVRHLRLAQAGIVNRDTTIGALCRELGITRQTLYRFLSPNGQFRADAYRLLGGNPKVNNWGESC